MHTFTRSIVATLLVTASLFARTAEPEATRGALLYETHCIACHTEQMHWRDKRLATDWPSLKRLVQHWQGNVRLDWGDDDIDSVAQYLNQRFYHFVPAGALVSQLPLGDGRNSEGRRPVRLRGITAVDIKDGHVPR
jgi:uncharacterized protein Usg